MKKVIVSLSGGMDSAVTAALAINQGCDVSAVIFTYGSKHNQYENLAAKNFANHMGIGYQIINLENVFENFPSSLMKDNQIEIPEGHYAEESMKSTVVPGRNIIFLSILSGLAWSIEAEEIWLGIHAGDHPIYPDCRPEFFSAMSSAVHYGTDDRIRLVAPFLRLNKGDIVKTGLDLNVPFRLTRTCYKNQPVACGKCGSCVERLEAFEVNGVTDPIPYVEYSESEEVRDEKD